MTEQLDLFGITRPDRDYLGPGPRIDIYGIIEAGRRGGENPYLRGTFEHSLFEDGRRDA